jgi:hypothetical protein
VLSANDRDDYQQLHQEDAFADNRDDHQQFHQENKFADDRDDHKSSNPKVNPEMSLRHQSIEVTSANDHDDHQKFDAYRGDRDDCLAKKSLSQTSMLIYSLISDIHRHEVNSNLTHASRPAHGKPFKHITATWLHEAASQEDGQSKQPSRPRSRSSRAAPGREN